MQKKKTFYIESLGCRTNQYEKEAYATGLKALGYEEATEDASLCIINTCTVTGGADSSSRHAIRTAARKHPNAAIFVTGCLATRDSEALTQLAPNITVIPNEEKEALLQYIVDDDAELPEFSIKQFSGHSRAFIKVQDGCNSFCSYCIIPYVRGRSRCRTIESIFYEVEQLLENGYQEIVLTGINIGDFRDQDKQPALSALVRALDTIPKLKRLRISSIDPDDIDEHLEDAIINGRTTCPSLHMVLQSGSNAVLKRMYRSHTRQDFCAAARKLRMRKPEFTFTTDVIVGFPGETEQDFEETLAVVSEVEFVKVHIFPYCDRPGTKASLMQDKVPQEVINHRKERLQQHFEAIAKKIRERVVGQTVEILTEEHPDPNLLSGHTTNFLPVTIVRGCYKPNQLLHVKLIENKEETLFAEVLE